MKTSKLLRRIEITPSFLVFLCAYYYFDPAATFVPFLLSVFLHETGHLLALWLCKAPIHKLRLGLSGTTICTAPLSYKHEIITAAAGPAMNFILVLFCLHRQPEMALLNLGLMLYNLLPLYPLDGGRILRSVLHLLLQDKTAALMEQLICFLCFSALLGAACYLTCVLHAGLWPLLVFLLLFLRTTETIFRKRGFCS